MKNINKTLHFAIVTLIITGLAMSGCTEPTSVASDQVARQVQIESQTTPDAKHEAIKAMFGHWDVDVEATMAMASSLPEEVRRKIREELNRAPFTLEINEHDYISQGTDGYTVVDRYSVLSALFDGSSPMVVLELVSAYPEKQKGSRTSRMQLQNGKLLIFTPGLTVAMVRSTKVR